MNQSENENVLPQPPKPSPRRSWQSWLSKLAAGVLLIPIAGLAALGAWRWASDGLARAKPTLMLLGAASTAAVVLMISARMADRRDRGLNDWPRSLQRLLHPWVLLLLTPPVIVLGAWLAEVDTPLWLLFPIIHVLAVGLPLLWFLRIGLRALPLSPPSRPWGAFSVGLVLTPLLTLLAETGVFLLIALAVGMMLTLNPAWRQTIELLTRRLIYAPSPRVIQRVLAPYLRQPLILYGGLVLAAGIVPLIEEAIKPLAVWRLLGDRDPHPVEGFVLGALSGAGFAYYETLTVALLPTIWLSAVLSRIGTGLLHIATAALTGWGMVTAWREGRYDRLGLAYLTSVLLHTLWNGITLATVLTTLPATSPKWAPLQTAGPLGLAVLTIGLLLWWLASRRALARVCYNQR